MWYVGQKVVCVRAPKSGKLTVDQIYEVLYVGESKCRCNEVILCVNCAVQSPSIGDVGQCGKCKEIFIDQWPYAQAHFAKYFIPLEDYYNQEKAVQTAKNIIAEPLKELVELKNP